MCSSRSEGSYLAMDQDGEKRCMALGLDMLALRCIASLHGKTSALQHQTAVLVPLVSWAGFTWLLFCMRIYSEALVPKQCWDHDFAR